METTKQKEKQSVPSGFVPLRNTLQAEGVHVGYDATKDAPIINGKTLNKNDSRLMKVGDDYYMDAAYAKSFIPKAYKNPYKEDMDTVLSELYGMQFSYNPNTDTGLQMAQKQAMLAAKQSANARGLLGGSTAETMRQRAAQELVPQYERLAYDRFLEERNAKLETLSVLEALSDNAFREYTGKEELAQKTQGLHMEAQSAADNQAALLKTEALEKEKMAKDSENRAFTNQLQKVVAMGVVDEEAAEVLGVPAGTLTFDQLSLLKKLQAEEEALRLEEQAAAEEWEKKKAYLKMQTDEKIRAALATRK